jgi:isopenicillin-N epimerase
MVAIPVPPQDPQALRQRLFDNRGIEVPVTTHRDRVFVRVSVQGYNTAAEIQRLLDAPALAA